MILVTVSTGHFDPLIEACDRLSTRYEFLGQIGSGFFTPSFKHFKTAPPQELEKHMAASELVISHGGTGMLSMLYRLKKPAIVVPKQVRYGEANDSQVELAKKWDSLGMALLCLDVNDLEAAILKARNTSFKFPSFPKLGEALRQLLLNAEYGIPNAEFSAR